MAAMLQLQWQAVSKLPFLTRSFGMQNRHLLIALKVHRLFCRHVTNLIFALESGFEYDWLILFEYNYEYKYFIWTLDLESGEDKINQDGVTKKAER